MDWIEEFEQKLDNGEITTDSQIKNFIEERQEECTHEVGKAFLAVQIWAAYYRWQAKGTPCEGCKHVGCWGLYPCNECGRKIQLFDYYDCEQEKS